ncbi:vWA domain-containing protein [Anaerosalibacter sp. Marseille-P3206]|uniref:vWA domain-containing protein n=1 Tax=Anaerosalibacter sp. Marseille-P3206 TaxID=1871005 RepID=UPI000984FEFF|nr:VWA domain-containing protein [Anaerosalibacter sp. Marseille-P3206]
MNLKQIVLITDGESNLGISPIEAAKKAYEKGIRVNTIGIVKNSLKEMPLVEVEEIASSGGGICQITNLENLSNALSMVTVASVQRSIEELVNKELKCIIDKDTKEVSPKTRGKIIRMMENLEDEIPIKCLLILDTSGSMKNKIKASKMSVLELLRFLKERKGKSEVGVITYPGDEAFYKVLANFTSDIAYLEEHMESISIGGVTPTGPALEGGIHMLLNENVQEREEGVLSDYII